MTYLIVTKLMLVHLLLFLGFPWDGDNLTTDIIICTLRIIPLGFVVVVVVVGFVLFWFFVFVFLRSLWREPAEELCGSSCAAGR